MRGDPSVSVAFDVMGRQIEAHDAAGVTTFAYDSFGSITNEMVVGVARTNKIERCWDAFGRTAGYARNGTRQTTIGYDPVTARIESMLTAGSTNEFRWTYLTGSDLKSSLSYPNGLTASWQYDANAQLLQVRNATPTNVISQYDYGYDAADRRVQISRSGSAMSANRTDVYGYNARGELISASKLRGATAALATTEHAYQYDDIGNRLTTFDFGTNCSYVANNLNQYTSISNLGSSASLAGEFQPQFDDDGNQTLIQSTSGIWQVQYNGENRPVFWSNDMTNIVMQFDRMGRRIEYFETCGATTNRCNTFVYDNYLLIARNHHAPDGTFTPDCFVWDITEHVATRPLEFYSINASPLYYSHDGNKNVTELTTSFQTVSAHYEYTPFGVETVMFGESVLASPLRFSCEFVDDTLSLLYYNFRNYDVLHARWMNRDPLVERSFILSFVFYSMIKHQNQIENEYLYVYNRGNCFYDWIGLDNPGCDIPPSVVNGKHRDCLRRCCAKHDECYFSRNGTSSEGKCPCKAGSWSMNMADIYMRMNGGKDLFGDDPCRKCNSDVVSCFMRCYTGTEPGGPRWFCPNGDHAGEFYDNWDDVPASCFESGQKPYWPPDEDSPPPPPVPYYRPSIPEVFDSIVNL